MRFRSALSLAGVVILSTVASAASAETNARVVTREGTPWLFVGARGTPSRAVDLHARARAAVAATSPFAARLARSLVTTSVDRFGDGDTIVRLEQSHLGLPVIGRGAAVRVAKGGEVRMTAVDLESDLPASATPKVDAAGAAAAAARFSRVGARPDEAHLVVWPTRDQGGRLAWVVLPRVPEGLPTAPRVVIDAENGDVLEARDLVVFATASMYPANPVKTPDLQTLEIALAPEGGKLSNAFLQANNCVDNKTVKPVNFFGFNQSMHVCDLVQSATADGNGNFVYAPADEPGSPESKRDEFSELSMYYHAARAYAFFRDLQGDPDAQVVVDKPLRVIANLQLPPGVSSGNFGAAGNPDAPLEPFSNAFFSPAGGGLGSLFSQLYGFDSGALWFGQGPQRDYAYDGDVVYHEFGHAVVDRTLKLGAWTIDARGAIAAPGAMNEALSDYFSSAITGDGDVGEYASKDLSVGGAVIRTLDNTDRCPTAVVGQVHHDSTLFSGALWQARKALPEADRGKLDAALYKAMRTNPGRGELGYGDLGKLFLATLQTDFPAGATALEAALTDRGILPSCERIFELEGDSVKAPTSSPFQGFSAPGAPSLGIRGLAPGILQVRAALPKGTVKVEVSFTTRRSGGGGGGSPFGGQGTPFTPVVLAKFGKPITWTTAKSVSHDADANVEATANSASFDVPEGAEAVYVQIANQGDEEGIYDAIAIKAVPGEAPIGAPNPGDQPAPPATTVDEAGCACSTPGQGAGAVSGSGLAAALAALAGLVRRRRPR